MQELPNHHGSGGSRMMHPRTREEGARFLAGHAIPPSAMGYVVAGALLAPNLVYCTLAFAFHTMHDSSCAECSLALQDPSCWRDPAHSTDAFRATVPPQVQLAGEGPQEVGSRVCLAHLIQLAAF
ncbi:hypothetical protein MDA_GLEAN10022989 [Myotis davidii]|uniref:Uncharacterized protein n=1 Tax=Myotis davidii TaxID=225400 RepID=L5LX15_MYODS|nr:hypothetical protein MDA_GLEAN10022989 [Myotis davidii]